MCAMHASGRPSSMSSAVSAGPVHQYGLGRSISALTSHPQPVGWSGPGSRSLRGAHTRGELLEASRSGPSGRAVCSWRVGPGGNRDQRQSWQYTLAVSQGACQGRRDP